MPRRRKTKVRVPAAHTAPAAVPAPQLAEEIPLLIRLEREIEDELRPRQRARLEEKLREVDAAGSVGAPACAGCGQRMKNRGRKRCSFVTRFGAIELRPVTYRCDPCRVQVRPLLARLGAEAGQLSGSLARLLALLGCVVPYELAAKLCHHFFGVEVSAMTVWRAVQRLGASLETYVEAQARYHADPHRSVQPVAAPPLAVVMGVDGSMLGMQVRATRRRRHGDEVLPPLTGVLLLPHERVEPSPGRRSVTRRILVTCLGDADRIFARLWAKLHDLGWLGPETVVVVIGDGAEWIWNRASLFTRRCEILGFWHVVEKAWELARLRYGDESKRVADWVTRLGDDLKAGKVDLVLARLATQDTATDEQREALETLLRYYTDNRARMRYVEYLRLGYGIGSGAVESAHQQVVQARLRQAGMRWSEAGAQRLLALRVLLLNGQFSLLDRLTMKRGAA